MLRRMAVEARPRPVVLAVAVGLAALTVGLGGCSTDVEQSDAGLSASAGDTRAAVSVPEGEAASIGTYTLRVAVSSGSRSECTSEDASEDGPGGGDRVITGERDGSLTGLWVDDITGNGHPDVIVSMASAGSGSYGSCHVYARAGESFERIELALLTDEQREGFMGHDSFRVADGVLYREFPVYASDDPNTRPSGGVLGYRYDFESATWVAP